MSSRTKAPMKATSIALMIGCPTITIDQWNAAERKPPRNAPTMPISASPTMPRPCPSARWLARKPATRPTRIQTRIVSKSRFTAIWMKPPFEFENAQAGASTRSCVQRCKDGKGGLLTAAAEAEQPQHEEQQDRTDEGDDDLADDRAPGDRDVDLEDLGQDPAEEGADDAGDDVTEQAEVAPQRHAASQGARDEADEDPDDDLVERQAEVDRHWDGIMRPWTRAPGAPRPARG